MSRYDVRPWGKPRCAGPATCSAIRPDRPSGSHKYAPGFALGAWIIPLAMWPGPCRT
ncbi:hypothetical protein [Streptomyces sp. NPDC056883]|uniref:hypothetical protein n=1 Tax=Streptomyces sp. NPDC056883 TaxID=3345959 RepID=UPI0036C09552